MGKKSEITRQKIMDAAYRLFIEKGYDGLRMQELADRAGVNKGLLHHYFRSKQALFNSIFTRSVDELFGRIIDTAGEEKTLEARLHGIVDVYFDTLLDNPQLPVFVFFELNRNPQQVLAYFGLERLRLLVNNLSANGQEIPIRQALHMVVSMVSLCVFPFMARPVILQFMKNQADFSRFIEERRPLVKSLLSHMLLTL